MNPVATKHSIEKYKERLGVNEKRAHKRIDNALCRGKTAESFTSWEKSFLEQKGKSDCCAVAYDGYCYIVNSQNICVTLYPLPKWFGQKKHFDGKEKIRNFKKYSRLHMCIEGRAP